MQINQRQPFVYLHETKANDGVESWKSL